MEYHTLSNGIQMPVMGLGTDDVFYLRKRHRSKNKYLNYLFIRYERKILKPLLDRKLSNTIAEAIKMGYRLIDTSAIYFNEGAIGRAIRISGVPREQIFITTRVTNKQQFDNNIREGFFQSLKELGVDYIDLYQFHWPVPGHYLDTWREMEKLYQEGYIKALGVANCHQHHLEEILKICTVPPMVNEVEVHPLFSQKPLKAFCDSKNIRMEAYTPLARNDERLRRNKILLGLAKKYNKTPQQIIIRWHIENGIVPIPRSTNINRLRSNVDVFDFHLTKEEIENVDSININSRLRYDPDNCDFTLL